MSGVNTQTSGESQQTRFAIPFVLRTNEMYPLWLYEVIQEIKRTFGPDHHRYVLSYLQRQDSTSQLPSDEEDANRVISNIAELSFGLVREGISPDFDVKPRAMELGMDSWLRYHESLCDYDDYGYLKFLIYWALRLKLKPPVEEASRILAANAFTLREISHLNDLQGWSYHCGDSVENYLEFIDLGDPMNISERVCRAAEKGAGASADVLKAARYQNLGKHFCLYCNSPDHLESVCTQTKPIPY